MTLRAVLAEMPGPRRWFLRPSSAKHILKFLQYGRNRARRLGPVLAGKSPGIRLPIGYRFRNRCFEHCMTRPIPAAAGSPSDPLTSPQLALSGSEAAASGAAIGTGILWMLVATCLFVCQDSTARILLKSLSGDGDRLRALFRSHGFGRRLHCLARPAPHDLAPTPVANAAVELSPRRNFVWDVRA